MVMAVVGIAKFKIPTHVQGVLQTARIFALFISQAQYK